MPVLLVVGGGLFGSLAAAYARSNGIEALVFDAQLDGSASHAAAGLFNKEWSAPRFAEHFSRALPLLERLYDVRSVSLMRADGTQDFFQFVSPRAILERSPIRERVTSVGDGWLEAGGRRYDGWVYVAAGIWSAEFIPDLELFGKGGASFVFAGERPGQIRAVTPGLQGLVFVRDPGTTHFSDGTAERSYNPDVHDCVTLERAATFGLTEPPMARLWGWRPYTPRGPVFRKVGARTWVATGGRKLGTLIGASFARRLVEEELR